MYFLQVFKVQNRLKRDGLPVYKVEDLHQNTLKGTFYQEELQKVTYSPDDPLHIEKIVKRGYLNGRARVLVKFKHWPKAHNLWVWEDQLEDV